MNVKKPSNIRWDVVQQLYLKLHRLSPGTKEAEVVEHAITLALSFQRKAHSQSFLTYDVIRNARYSTQRTHKRLSKLSRKLNSSAIHANTHIDCKTPLAVYIAQEVEAKIRESIAPIGLHMVRCFDGMLMGESITETAKACGISSRSVNRARQEIRAIAKPFFFEQELSK